MLPRNPLTSAAESSGAHASQAAPGLHTSCISSTMTCAGSRTVHVMVVSEHRSGVCPPCSLMLLPFPEGGFARSSDWPLCLCGSTPFAECLVTEVCKIPGFATVSLASKRHRPRFVKLEGPARRHLPTWQDHLDSSDAALGRFFEVPSAGDPSLCFSTDISYPFCYDFSYI